MYNRDYMKEIGLDPGDRIVPLRYVILLAALLAALCWFGARAWLRYEANGQATTADPVHVSIQS